MSDFWGNYRKKNRCIKCKKYISNNAKRCRACMFKSNEWRKKLSIACKGENNPMYGKTPWKGKHHTEKTKIKIGKANMGKKMSKESRKKMSIAKKKNPPTTVFKNGHTMTRMEKNANWRGGISFEPYGLKFNKELKEQIRKRDHYRCQECFKHQDELYSKIGRKYKLHIHHIDYDKKNNNPDNLISLCRNCHVQTNFNRKDWIRYYQIRIGERKEVK